MIEKIPDKFYLKYSYQEDVSLLNKLKEEFCACPSIPKQLRKVA